MKILWCEVHESNGQRDTSICYRWALFLASGKELAGDCRMVPMRLIPDNAAFDENDEGVRLIRADLDGETP